MEDKYYNCNVKNYNACCDSDCEDKDHGGGTTTTGGETTTTNSDESVSDYSSFAGDIKLMPFNGEELPFGWYTCNGGTYDSSTDQFGILSNLSEKYKSDWKINTNIVVKEGESQSAITATTDANYLQKLHIEGQSDNSLNGEYEYFANVSLAGVSPDYDTTTDEAIAGYVKDNEDSTYTYILNYNANVSSGDNTKFFVSTISPDDSRWSAPLEAWFSVTSEATYFDGATTYTDSCVDIGDVYYLNGVNLGASDYYYGYDNSTQLQLPKIDNSYFKNTINDSDIGNYENGSLPNIKGSTSSDDGTSNLGLFSMYAHTDTGAITTDSKSHRMTAITSNNSTRVDVMHINASLYNSVYKDDQLSVDVNNIKMLPCIYLGV